VGRGQQPPPAAIAPPVGGYLAPHMQVSNDLFIFLTGTIGTAAIIQSFPTKNGYLTTVEVPGK
jgi:hypothetical protein